MTQVIVDAALRSKLHDLSMPLDLCDESGKVLAHVVPAINPDDYEPGPEPQLSEEELKKLESSKGYTRAEALKYLGWA